MKKYPYFAKTLIYGYHFVEVSALVYEKVSLFC